MLGKLRVQLISLLALFLFTSSVFAGEFCYQETANQATGCGGLSSGSYSCSGSICPKVYDGDWSSSTGGNTMIAYINYTIPENAVRSSTRWQIGGAWDNLAGSLAVTNLSLPADCLKGNTLSLKVYNSGQYSYWECFNNSEIITVAVKGGGGDNKKIVYEEGVWWNLTVKPSLIPYLISPNESTTVNKNEYFSFSSGVKCVGNCGNVTATLDPINIIHYEPSDEIQLRSRSFTPSSTAITASSYNTGREHLLMQFDHILNNEEKAKLESEGLKFMQYIPNKAWLVSAPAGRYFSDVRWSGKLQPSDKISQNILNDNLGAWSISRDGDLILLVQFYDDIDTAEALEIIKSYDGKPHNIYPAINAIVTKIAKSQISGLAAQDQVMWIGELPPPLESLNDDARLITGAEELQAAPYDLDGENITVYVFDGGLVDGSHTDLQGRVTYAEPGDLSAHATHVSCSVGGTGAKSQDLGGSAFEWRGMAPAVDIISGEYDSCTPYCLYNSSNDIESDYQDAIDNYNIDIATNSIGSNIAQNGLPCDWEGDYELTSQLVDGIIRGSLGKPLPSVWANGNERSSGSCGSGYRTTAPPAGMKNSISVGATNKDDTITSFSGFGPTDDGRIKPDISAPGLSIKSCIPGDDYDVYSGTSMAAPVVAGNIALMMQSYRKTHDTIMSPSTIKALLIHTAKDLGNPGPDYQFGYGRIDSTYAIDLISSDTLSNDLITESILLDQSDSEQYYVSVPAGTPQLKLSLVWTDYPGTPLVEKELVNDLDLVVLSPDGDRYYPFTLDSSNPSFTAVQTKEDHINNMEQVLVNDPVPGRWQIIVAGRVLPEAPQDFSLVSDIDMDTSKGTIPMNNGNPFYTIDQNPVYPANLSCLQNMQDGDSCNQTWTVNATGAHLSAHNFFVIYSGDNIEETDTGKIQIQILGNYAPEVNSIECQENNGWGSCENLMYNDTLTNLRVNCTDSDGIVTQLRIKLENLPDNNIFFDSMAVMDGNFWVYDLADIILKDSGDYRLSISCTDDGGLEGIKEANGSVDWFVPWGVLSAYTIDPVGDISVIQNNIFQYSAAVDCLNGECGTVGGTLTADLTLYKDDFESEIDWNSDSLWHITSSDYHSESNSYWYGDEDTGNYDTYSDNQGSLISPMINLTGALSANLIFWYWYETEDEGSSWDQRWIRIKVNDSDWQDLEQLSDDQMQTWTYKSVDLTQYAGSIIQLMFYFDTIDDISNDYKGWLVDDVSVISSGYVPMSSGTPFYTLMQNPIYCGHMGHGDSCKGTWGLNATGMIQKEYVLQTFFNPIQYSSQLQAAQTDKIQVDIQDQIIPIMPNITILNPVNNSVIAYDHLWLNISTVKDAECSYTLKKCADNDCALFPSVPMIPIDAIVDSWKDGAITDYELVKPTHTALIESLDDTSDEEHYEATVDCTDDLSYSNTVYFTVDTLSPKVISLVNSDVLANFSSFDICLAVPISGKYNFYNLTRKNYITSVKKTSDCGKYDFIIGFNSYESFLNIYNSPTYDNIFNSHKSDYYLWPSKYVKEDNIECNSEFQNKYCGSLSNYLSKTQFLFADLSCCVSYNPGEVIIVNESMEAYYGITIPSDHITFDCNNYMIKSSDEQNLNTGIYLHNRTNVTVQNCIVDGFYHGIGLWDQTSGNTMKNNDLQNNMAGFIVTSGSNNNVITENTCSNNGFNIVLSYNSNNYITKNTITNTIYGVMLTNASNSVILDNTFNSNNVGVLLQFNSNNNSVFHNFITANDIGVQLWSGSERNSFQYNVFSGNTNSSFRNEVEHNVLADYNYWGTTDCSEINNEIYDNYDNASFGIVHYEPFFDAPFGNAVYCKDIVPLGLTILSPLNNSVLNTDSTTLEVSTNMDSTCTYQVCKHYEYVGGGGSGCSPVFDMSTTGSTFHSQFITNLGNTVNNQTHKEWYTVPVNCTDFSGNSKSKKVNLYVNYTDSKPIVILSANSTFGTEPLSVKFECQVGSGNPPFIYGMNFGNGFYIESIESIFSASEIYLFKYSEGEYTANCSVKDNNSKLVFSNNILIQVEKFEDTIPPLITFLISDVSITKAKIFWTTDELANSTVYYGANESLLDNIVSDSTLTSSHVIDLENLESNTTYYYKAGSCDLYGNCIETPVNTFKTMEIINNPPTLISFYPKLNPKISEDSMQQFTISVFDDDNLTFSWYVNSIKSSNLDSYTYYGNGLSGIYAYNITVIVSDGLLTASHSWALTQSSVPIAEGFGGSTSNFSKIPDLKNASNIIFEKPNFGKINFGDNILDLSDIVDLNSFVLISDNIIGIDTATYPALNKSAKITMYNLGYSQTPIIYYNGGFTTNSAEITTVCPATLCYNIAYNPTTGTLTFDVAHFSVFKVVGMSVAMPVPAPKIPIKINNNVKISSAKIINDYIQPGEDLQTKVSIENEGNTDLDDVKITLVIPELALRKRIGPFDLDEGDDITELIYAQMPDNTPPGEYLVRITISNDKVKRVRHRSIIVR
ncbi:MAG: S8 family serine peptidase [Nanoarchaeota archaeon]